MSIIIEELFPEVCNLFGDMGNMRYLKLCLPDAEFIETALNDKPYFAEHDVNMIYLGPMTENTQEQVIRRLEPYKDRIKELIRKNVVFLATGNAQEIFGMSITDSGKEIKCLEIFDFKAKRDMMHRFSGLVLGNYGDLEMVGFRAQFTRGYLGNSLKPFVNVVKGDGMNSESKAEGFVVNNFYGTYILGPLLVLNPYFTKRLIKQICGEERTLAFEAESIKAYNTRLEDFKDSHVGIH